MITAIYTRISTDKQTHDSQIDELRAYCQRRGWTGVREFTDTISGSKFTRKGLDELMVQVRKGKVQNVVVFKLDRLGRSLSHLAILIGELNAHNVGLICTTQGLDTSQDSAVGRLQLGVLMAVAEFEKEIIRERVKAGLSAAKARGQKLGKREWLSKHESSVRPLLEQGKGIREIARILEMPSSSVMKLAKRIRMAAPLAA